jgi:hypothetical protein
MRMAAWFATALLALAPAPPASAFMVYPDRDNPDNLIVFVERPYGDLVEFRMLPKPFDQVVQTRQGPDAFSFRWQYAREPQEGMAFLTVDEDGLGTMHFEFWGDGLDDGDTLAAAALLVDRDGRALHVFYAKADYVGAAFAGGSERHATRLAVERVPDWWQSVGGVAFFYMKYFTEQRPDEDGVWRAMQRTVDTFGGGKATWQRE